jgi:multidrug efflux pump subunit AcrB
VDQPTDGCPHYPTSTPPQVAQHRFQAPLTSAYVCRLFIKRPVFATVCALLILLGGERIAIPTPRIAHPNNISPTQITLHSNYSGASAEVVENAVANYLGAANQRGRGHWKYMKLSSSTDGTSRITACFDHIAIKI